MGQSRIFGLVLIADLFTFAKLFTVVTTGIHYFCSNTGLPSDKKNMTYFVLLFERISVEYHYFLIFIHLFFKASKPFFNFSQSWCWFLIIHRYLLRLIGIKMSLGADDEKGNQPIFHLKYRLIIG